MRERKTNRQLPMFPLGTVLFPFAPLRLQVFEPRYRVMVRDLLSGDGEFGVVLIERGSEVGGGDVRFSSGTIAKIVRATETGGGRYALHNIGIHRLRVEEWLPDDPYPRARVTELDEPAPDATTTRRVLALAERLDIVHSLLARLEDREAPPPVRLSDDPVRASFEAAALAPVGPLDAQRLLDAPGARERAELLHGLLADATELLRARLAGGGGR